MLNVAPFELLGRRAVLLTDGEFSTFGAKTAVCYLRYRSKDVVAVVDHASGGRSAEDIVGFGGSIPVFADVEGARRCGPEIAIVGVAPRGGRLTESLRRQILDCVHAGMDVVSGLHDFLREDEAIAEAAAQSGSQVWDVREVSEAHAVGTGRGCITGAKSVLFVGSDCNVGKMTATVEVFNEAARRGVNAAWAATGQTGMMLRGKGIAIDRVVADFIGGAAEALVNHEGRDRDVVFVEGQGSVVHPGYAGVTLGLMYGVMPDCMVLAHVPSRAHIGDSPFLMPPSADLVRLYEQAMAPLKISPVVAIAMNTAGFEAAAACDIMARAGHDTGLPVFDPVRFNASGLVDAILNHLQ